MKLSIILLFALVCLVAVSSAQKKKCDRKCPKTGTAICATNNKGKSYRRFTNSCTLGVENCKTKNSWKKVDLKKCRKK